MKYESSVINSFSDNEQKALFYKVTLLTVYENGEHHPQYYNVLLYLNNVFFGIALGKSFCRFHSHIEDTQHTVENIRLGIGLYVTGAVFIDENCIV